MTIFSVKATSSTPSIYFDPKTGLLEIKGRSIPENSVSFYQPLHDILDEFSKHPVKDLLVKIQLEYYNSSSSACILSLLKKLEAFKHQVNTVAIEWFYEEEDEDTLAAGSHLQSIIHLPFNMVKIKE